MKFNILNILKSVLISAAIFLPEYVFADATCPDVCSSCEDCQCSAQCQTFSQPDVESLWESITPSAAVSEYYAKFPLMLFEPKIYSGYRTVRIPDLSPSPFIFEMDPRISTTQEDSIADSKYFERIDQFEIRESDKPSVNVYSNDLPASNPLQTDSPFEELYDENTVIENGVLVKAIPDWLTTALRSQRIYQNIQYLYMVDNPFRIDYAYWDLPVPPRLPEEDHSFSAFLRSLDLPDIEASAAVLPEFNQRRINWLHSVGTSLQFSQAYISSNWYQGGNNYLALLFNFNWDVVLNTNFHPNLLFQSNLAYKLALNSNPKESIHKYSISQDILQYNLKMGLKAFKKWFYSFNLLFKTQIFNAYPADAYNLQSSFLSPGDFNVGLGMTYNLAKFHDTLKFSASISPISYNLKTCISNRIDHSQFNIDQARYTHSEIGSNAELNLSWNITSNISWKSRLFLFTDYHYFLADWENTFNFEINRFLSTQFYLHPRFDSSSDFNASKWHYWSLKEILSFGLSYTFSTKP